MPRIAYEEWSPRPETVALIQQANSIIRQYQAQGYLLTLRQLYYQFVARALIPNTQKSYNNLGGVIAKARMAGWIDWEAIEDRTRNLVKWQTDDSPQAAIARLRRHFTLEKWERQPAYVEVWVEKEALAGVFERICNTLEVPFFACRGYVSLSEMWSASQRLRERSEEGKQTIILHFGDHDPSGIDMTRDINDRVETFAGYDAAVEVWRIALNMPQVQQYSPPPNPAKLTDSRADDYVAKYGRQSWELDALDPATLSALVQAEVDSVRDQDLWDESVEEEEEAMRHLQAISDRYDEVTAYLDGKGD